MPTVGAATITSAASCHARLGQGNRSIRKVPPVSPTMQGNKRPRRSEMRPTTGLTADSRAAAVSQAAPITPAVTARASRRSGTSTAIVPNISPGTATSQTPAATRPSASAPMSSRGGDVPSGGAGGVLSAQPASNTATTATPQKVGAIPIAAPTIPTTGPASAPATAAPIVVPIISPRRSGGAALATHASAPAQEAAPATPWRKRAASSTTMEPANANATLDTVMSVSPSSTVARTPARAARYPPGMVPANGPARHAAASTPAPDFDRPNASSKWGRSG